MNRNEITGDEAGLLLDKLHNEHVPVIGYFKYVGMEVKLKGFIHAITAATGLELIERQDDDPKGKPTGYMVIGVGKPVGTGCTFFYGDKRELPEATRDQLSATLGDTILVIRPPGGGELRLFFSI